MILLVNPLVLPKHVRALTLWPFVMVRDQKCMEDAVLINHEKIHLRQQLEMLVLPFYLWYVLEFLVRWMYTQNRNRAYRSIIFEQEAYENEKDLDYLESRSWGSYLRYLNY